MVDKLVRGRADANAGAQSHSCTHVPKALSPRNWFTVDDQRYNEDGSSNDDARDKVVHPYAVATIALP